jgi:hypothetical protein
VRTSCCDEARACAADADCTDLAACAGACAPGDFPCDAACRTRHAAGYGASGAALEACKAARCGTACQLACGGYVYADPECASCSEAHCCSAVAACMTDATCTVLEACERACAPDDHACAEECEVTHPDGVTASRAFSACLAAQCPAPCTTEWACLRHPSAPSPTVGPGITLGYTFVDYETRQPIQGLRVRACGASDFDCAGALANAGPTGNDGVATLAIPSHTFTGYVEAYGRSDYVAALLFLPGISHDFTVPPQVIPRVSTYQSLLTAITTADPSRGTIIVAAKGCTGNPAPSVKFGVEPPDGAVPFYFASQVPSAVATATDDDGFSAGGFGNVKTGTELTVQGTVNDIGLTYAPQHAFVRAQGASLAFFSILYLYAGAP